MSRETLRSVLKNDIEKITLLVSKGADLLEVTKKEKWNYLHRALMLATKVPSIEMLSYLLESGIDVNSMDMYGNTPLYYAVRLKSPDLIKLLIESGANVNTINDEGVSPLRETLLAKPFNKECIKLLLANDADREQKNSNGLTIAELAEIVSEGDRELEKLFI